MNSVHPDRSASSRLVIFTCAGLLLAAIAVYWGVWKFDYVNYDDPNNIYQNPAVLGGLKLPTFAWGLTTSYFEYWHPVTWWSHMLDTEFFGPAPGGRHLVNLCFHLANTVLAFLLLRSLTGAIWRSAFVAALFALHPMQVESVAWLSERKDVLAAFFGLLSLLAYTRFAQNNPPSVCHPASLTSPHFQSRPYCWALVFFTLGLMSKPTVVTWPFVLLLLDIWPLQRLPRLGALFHLPASKALLIEKLPFVVLTILSSTVSYFSLKGESGKVLDGVEISTAFRLTNVPVSYVRYLGKLIWPHDLAVLYPLPAGLWPWWQIIGSLVLLGTVSILIWRWARQVPALLIGWLFFLGVLVPASGIVGVGLHAMADRFTYLPGLGLFVAFTWGSAELLRRVKFPVLAIFGGAAILLLALGAACWRQVRIWKDSETLWTHCLAVNSENAVAHYNLGHVLQHSGRAAAAVPHYEATMRLMPQHLDAPLNLGAIRFESRDYVAATNYFQRVLELKPSYVKAHLNYGMALNELQDFVSASNHLAQAVAADPNNLQIRCVYALTLTELGLAPAALEQAGIALQLSPNNGVALALLGRAHALRGEYAEAQQLFAQALLIAPDFAELNLWSGLESLRAGDLTAGLASLEAAIRLKPELVSARAALAAALVNQSRAAEGLAQYRAALELAPDSPALLNNLAWLLATTSNPELRNGAEAVRLARHACELTQFQQPILIGTLAAAFAEAGQFGEAAATASQAAELARELKLTRIAETNDKLKAQFIQHQPVRE